jgi:uncharacterized HhH-GPD family protein
MATTPHSLPWTGDEEADRLIAEDPVALLIGFVLDQQVTVQKAFSGPLELRRRLGHLDPERIAAADPAELAEVFRRRPALHRFPAAMAERVQALCALLVERYGGDATRIWDGAASGGELAARLGELPGFGPLKVRSVVATLVKRFGLRLPGIEDVMPGHPTLGDVDSAQALAAYQEAKRAHKRAARSAQEPAG